MGNNKETGFGEVILEENLEFELTLIRIEEFIEVFENILKKVGGDIEIKEESITLLNYYLRAFSGYLLDSKILLDLYKEGVLFLESNEFQDYFEFIDELTSVGLSKSRVGYYFRDGGVTDVEMILQELKGYKFPDWFKKRYLFYLVGSQETRLLLTNTEKKVSNLILISGEND